MPIKTGKLTVKEQAFVAAYVESGDRTTAERKAGYAPNGSYQVMARPEITAQVAQEQLARLTVEGLPLAVGTLFSIMRSEKSPAASRVQAAKIVIDRALPDATSGAGKELHEMSAAEIAAAIQAFEALIVDVTPADPEPAAPSILE